MAVETICNSERHPEPVNSLIQIQRYSAHWGPWLPLRIRFVEVEKDAGSVRVDASASGSMGACCGPSQPYVCRGPAWVCRAGPGGHIRVDSSCGTARHFRQILCVV